MGNDLRVIDEDIVNHAPIVGIEGAEFEGLAGDFHPLGDATDFFPEVIFLHRAEMGTIHFDALRLGVVAAEDAIDEILEVIQAVAIFADESFAVSGMDLQAGTVVSFLGLDRGREPEVSKHRIENLGC